VKALDGVMVLSRVSPRRRDCALPAFEPQDLVEKVAPVEQPMLSPRGKHSTMSRPRLRLQRG
jgi:hypothetical protein